MTLEELFDVKNEVVAITGAAGIIFSTVARGLADLGAKVALLDLMEDKAKEIVEEIVSNGGEAIAIRCNVLEEASIQTALDAIVAKWGHVDALINGAGGNRAGATVPRDGKFTDLDITELNKVFALNYQGTFLPTQVFCKYFAKPPREKGIVINTSSTAAILPLTHVPGYSNAKAAVTNFTRWLAVQTRVDFPKADIRVNEICPGFLDTTQNHRLLFEEDDKTLTLRGQSAIDHTPLRRFGDPQELLGTVVLLLSPAGSYIHGQSFVVDGGASICHGIGPLDEKIGQWQK